LKKHNRTKGDIAATGVKMEPTTCSCDLDRAVNLARQALYRFAALALADPRSGSWERLTALRTDTLPLEAAALIRSVLDGRPPKLGIAERSLKYLDPQPVLDQLPDSRCALNTQYEATFGLLVSSPCPPYETEYINSKFAFQRSNALADISGFYDAFGLKIADANPERPDHIVLQLEFMAWLLGMEQQAADGDLLLRDQRMCVCRDAQARFMGEHLACWAPPFAKLLAHENRGGFYEAVGVFLAALIPAERAFLKVDVQSRPMLPSPQERPEACEGCQLAT
jgi:TorA maturation chaperone TorD